ncbi:MAG: SIR2 family protein [Corynebacterium sp.]|uniref:SIR2 family protein n=1 Tax=Corynebacterium sp. TaxID=1720 RepID=UPI003F11DFDF
MGLYGASLKIGICSLLEGIQNERAKDGDLNYPEQYSDEICALKNAKVDGVITTNFDSMMEDLLPDFEKLIGQDQMLLGGTKLFGEIYKIHGSIDDPMSLVVTSEDYDSVERKNVYLAERKNVYLAERKNVYLAAKLLTIFAERPVIFLGYSMGDRYIQRILENVATAAGEYNLSLLSNRLIFVEWEPDPTTVPRMTDNSRQIGDTLIPSTLIRAHSFIPIFEALADLDARLPPRNNSKNVPTSIRAC